MRMRALNMFRFVRLKSASRHFELIEAARPIGQENSKSCAENYDETHNFVEVIPLADFSNLLG